MSQTAIKITLICETEVEKDIEPALENSQIPFRIEKLKTPTNAYCIYVPDARGALSVALDLLEAKKDVVSGIAVAAVYIRIANFIRGQLARPVLSPS